MYPAFKQMLLSQLQAAIAFQGKTFLVTPDSALAQLPTDIPLRKAKDTSQVIYVSGIALKLSRATNSLAFETAAEMVNINFC